MSNPSEDDDDWKTDDSEGDWDEDEDSEEADDSEEEESEEEESGEEEESASAEDDEDAAASSQDDQDDDEDHDEDEYADEYNDDEEDQKYAAAAEQYPYEDEPIVEEDEEELEARRAKTRKAILACCLCCLCLLIISGAVVLGVIMTQGDGDIPDISAPTGSPTPAPQTPAPVYVFPTSAPIVITKSPTVSPTISQQPSSSPTQAPTRMPTVSPSASPTTSPAPTRPVPDEIVILPDEDTFIYVDGFFQEEAFGKEDTMLVQNGPAAVNEVPDAFMLITFDLAEIPQPWRIVDRDSHAILRLTHVPRTQSGSAEPQSYTVSRLPSTPLAVESLHGLLFVPFDTLPGPSFTVNPGSQKLEVDITELLFDQPPFVPDMNSRRHDRDLQGPGIQLFLMISAEGPEQPDGGDRFRSRESDFSPELYIGLFQPGVPQPTKSPTVSPTMSLAPTLSLVPTSLPSGSPTSSDGDGDGGGAVR
jgi:hypothetical protein